MEKNDKKGGIGVFVFLSVVLVVAIIFIAIFFSMIKTGPAKPARMGLILTGTKDDGGWNQSHYEGFEAAAADIGNDYSVIENVAEEEESLRAAAVSLMNDGCKVVFLSSYGFAEYLSGIREACPDTVFYAISADPKSEDPARNANSPTFFARVYQARYLSGELAAMRSEKKKLGFVASYENPETLRSLNAFALGAQNIDPDVEVIVRYTGSWNDEEKEKAAVDALINDGVDLVTAALDTDAFVEECDKNGIYSIGYPSDYITHSDHFLCACTVEWGNIYKNLFRSFSDGESYRAGAYWPGLEENAVGLSGFSPMVTEGMKNRLINDGRRIASFDFIFEGELVDNKGRVRCPSGERISDESLFSDMDWYVSGVSVK